MPVAGLLHGKRIEAVLANQTANLIERQRRVLGSRPMFTHGLDGNLDLVHAFVRYGYEQGYTSRLLSTDELFAPLLG